MYQGPLNKSYKHYPTESLEQPHQAGMIIMSHFTDEPVRAREVKHRSEPNRWYMSDKETYFSMHKKPSIFILN